jgi:hypothetical protein
VGSKSTPISNVSPLARNSCGNVAVMVNGAQSPVVSMVASLVPAVSDVSVIVSTATSPTCTLPNSSGDGARGDGGLGQAAGPRERRERDDDDGQEARGVFIAENGTATAPTRGAPSPASCRRVYAA